MAEQDKSSRTRRHSRPNVETLNPSLAGMSLAKTAPEGSASPSSPDLAPGGVMRRPTLNSSPSTNGPPPIPATWMLLRTLDNTTMSIPRALLVDIPYFGELAYIAPNGRSAAPRDAGGAVMCEATKDEMDLLVAWQRFGELPQPVSADRLTSFRLMLRVNGCTAILRALKEAGLGLTDVPTASNGNGIAAASSAPRMSSKERRRFDEEVLKKCKGCMTEWSYQPGEPAQTLDFETLYLRAVSQIEEALPTIPLGQTRLITLLLDLPRPEVLPDPTKFHESTGPDAGRHLLRSAYRERTLPAQGPSTSVASGIRNSFMDERDAARVPLRRREKYARGGNASLSGFPITRDRERDRHHWACPKTGLLFVFERLAERIRRDGFFIQNEFFMIEAGMCQYVLLH